MDKNKHKVNAIQTLKTSIDQNTNFKIDILPEKLNLELASI